MNTKNTGTATKHATGKQGGTSMSLSPVTLFDYNTKTHSQDQATVVKNCPSDWDAVFFVWKYVQARLLNLGLYDRFVVHLKAECPELLENIDIPDHEDIPYDALFDAVEQDGNRILFCELYFTFVNSLPDYKAMLSWQVQSLS